MHSHDEKLIEEARSWLLTVLGDVTGSGAMIAKLSGLSHAAVMVFAGGKIKNDDFASRVAKKLLEIKPEFEEMTINKEQKIKLSLTLEELDLLIEAVLVYKGISFKSLLGAIYKRKLTLDDKARVHIEERCSKLEGLNNALQWIKEARLERQAIIS